MKCNIDKNDLLLLFCGELEKAENAAITQHAENCDLCQNTLKTWQQNVWLSQQIPVIEPPPIRLNDGRKKEAVFHLHRFRLFGFRLPRFGFLVLFAVVTIVMTLIFRTEASDLWSLENSWQSPGQPAIAYIQEAIAQMENDPFFKLEGDE